jgi:hypothetical protein
VDDNGTTSAGALEGLFDGTDTLTITAYTTSGAFELQDTAAGQAYPSTDAGTYQLDMTDTAGAGSDDMQVPAAVSVKEAWVFLDDINGSAGSIDIFLEDNAGTPTRLTTSTTFGPTRIQNTWFRLVGNGVASVKGRTLHVTAENKSGTISTFNVDLTFSTG